MKTLLSYVAFAALILTSSFTIDTQQQLNEKASGCFSHFRAHRQAQGINLSWAISSPEVEQFMVERSDDGEFYTVITAISRGNASSFKYQDDEAYAGYNHYRIVAVKSDGNTECSPVQTVRIVKKN